MMLTQSKTQAKLTYREQFFSDKSADPIVILHNFQQAGFLNKYLLYEGEGEVRVAIGEFIKIAVSSDRVWMVGNESKFKLIRDPFKNTPYQFG